MAKSVHAQKPDSSLMTCTACKDGKCTYCVDVPRAKAGLSGALCTCRRATHRERLKAALE